MRSVAEWRQYDRDRADAEVLERAAAWLRERPERTGYAGLSHDHVAEAVAALLDLLAVTVGGLDPGVRRQAVQSCRVLLGETMDSPTQRRTRRR